MTFDEWWESQVFEDDAPVWLARQAWDEATKEEREACAKVAEQHEEGHGVAEAIRARSNA